MTELFAALETQALRGGARGRICGGPVRLTRLLDLRYPHQGYTLGVPCASAVDRRQPGGRQAGLRCAARQVYGQTAPREDAEIVTFRVQAEIDVPRLELANCARTDGNTARAIKGERPLYDTTQQKFDHVNVWDRAKLSPAIASKGRP